MSRCRPHSMLLRLLRCRLFTRARLLGGDGKIKSNIETCVHFMRCRWSRLVGFGAVYANVIGHGGLRKRSLHVGGVYWGSRGADRGRKGMRNGPSQWHVCPEEGKERESKRGGMATTCAAYNLFIRHQTIGSVKRSGSVMALITKP